MARPPKLTDEALTAALAAHPEATAAEVAGVLGVGQSTVAKRLAALEEAGAVHRSPGGRVAGVRAPDHWSVVTGSDVAEPENAASEPTPAEAAAEHPEADSTRDRLGRGELGALVRDYLAARPGESFGPAAIGKALGRSQGAVSNSLSTMAARGEAVLVADTPRRYRIAS
jgi:DNA-binding transcriptional ArsR family regulator